MRTLAFVAMLALLPGCAGVLTGGGGAAPECAPPAAETGRVAYRLTLTSKPGTVTTAAPGKQLLDDNTADTAQIGIAAFFRKVPIIGWIVGAKMLAREAAKMAGKPTGGRDPITEAVLREAVMAAREGREVTLTAEPVWVGPPVPDAKPFVLPLTLTTPK